MNELSKKHVKKYQKIFPHLTIMRVSAWGHAKALWCKEGMFITDKIYLELSTHVDGYGKVISCHHKSSTWEEEFGEKFILSPDPNTNLHSYLRKNIRENSMGRKTLKNTEIDGAKKNVPDIVVYGVGDLFKLISKASSEEEGWMKSTKAMQTDTGLVVQVTTQQYDNVAEALCFIPGGKLRGDAVKGWRIK